MNIRTYTPSDQPDVIQLLQLNTPTYFAPEEEADYIDFLHNHIDRYFVAEMEGKVLACGGFNLADGGQTARISWDMVHPDSQGIGIGSALLEYRINEIMKLESVQLISVRTTQLVYKFYEKSGFELKEIAKDFWAPGFDLYNMHRKKRI